VVEFLLGHPIRAHTSDLREPGREGRSEVLSVNLSSITPRAVNVSAQEVGALFLDPGMLRRQTFEKILRKVLHQKGRGGVGEVDL
jgi:hypothetical protein